MADKVRATGGSMSRITERLIQAACVAIILFGIWSLAERSFIAIIQANQRAIIAEQRATSLEGQVQQCRGEKAK